MPLEPCAFCEIVAGVTESSGVHETESVIAFMDIDPMTPGHVLVAPKAHMRDLADVSDILVSEMMDVARKVATALRGSELQCVGVNLFCADGEAAGQEVPHAHLHVVPRFADDGVSIDARWGSGPSRHELDEIAAKLRRVGRTAMDERPGEG